VDFMQVLLSAFHSRRQQVSPPRGVVTLLDRCRRGSSHFHLRDQ
jgi:hypothetical protein